MRDILKEEIEDKIINVIGTITNRVDAEKYCENCCSVWGNYDEIIEYLGQDGEVVTEEELRLNEYIVELSNGEILFIG